MPRLRRKRVDTFDYSDRTRMQLMSGHDFDFLEGEALTEDDLREAWEELREELIEVHIREYPGTRPWAWWKWDEQVEQPIQLQDRPGETDYLEAHGLLTEGERQARSRRRSPRPAEERGDE